MAEVLDIHFNPLSLCYRPAIRENTGSDVHPVSGVKVSQSLMDLCVDALESDDLIVGFQKFFAIVNAFYTARKISNVSGMLIVTRRRVCCGHPVLPKSHRWWVGSFVPPVTTDSAVFPFLWDGVKSRVPMVRAAWQQQQRVRGALVDDVVDSQGPLDPLNSEDEGGDGGPPDSDTNDEIIVLDDESQADYVDYFDSQDEESDNPFEEKEVENDRFIDAAATAVVNYFKNSINGPFRMAKRHLRRPQGDDKGGDSTPVAAQARGCEAEDQAAYTLIDSGDELDEVVLSDGDSDAPAAQYYDSDDSPTEDPFAEKENFGEIRVVSAASGVIDYLRASFGGNLRRKYHGF
jgi:hypothetical protein